MTAAAKLAARADPIECFRARAQARAHLFSEGELDLHQAVDVLQADAERDGLVRAIGQDRVQALMAKAFAAVCKPQIVEPACDVVPEPLPEPPKRGVVPEATLDAADWLVRQNDPDRLRRWLNGRSRKERAAIQKHLERKRCSARNR